MAYEPLHHKYRPQAFGDLVGQEAIATTLTNAILQSRIAPAYLFTGPRGTGKTSSARILAKSLNCQSGDAPTPKPCGTCEACRSIVSGSALDVIEIDAASNTGVDNIRELIEKAQFAPVQCRFKVYVIDECHMLSTAAFNALLKTLEEPPERVVFVLATTDPQRVLPTIISRCQRFDYRRIPLESMVTHLRFIADQEQIEIEQDALTLVAQIAQGGLRDAESLLDQLSLLPPPIRVEAVWDLVGAVPERDLLALAEAIATNQPEGIIERARHLMNRGREPLIVLQNLASFYRDLLIAKTAPQRNDLVAITPTTWEAITTFVESITLETLLQGQQHLRASEVQLKNTTQPRLWLEVTLLGLLPGAQVVASAAPAMSSVAAVPTPVAIPVVPTAPAAAPAPVPAAPPVAANIAPSSAAPPSSTAPTQVAVPPPPEPPRSVQQATPGAGMNAGAASQEGAAAHGNLQELWKRIVANVEFRSTQMLLRQQGRLLRVTEKAARVGINERWISNLQGKLPAIEAAFAKTLGQPLKVSLEPVSPQAAAEDVPGAVPLTPAASAAISAPPPTPSNPVAQPVPQAAPPSPAPTPSPSPAAVASVPTPASTAAPSVPEPVPAPVKAAPMPAVAPHSGSAVTHASPAPGAIAPPQPAPPPQQAPSPDPQPETPSSASLLPIGTPPSSTAPPGQGMNAPGLADWDEGELLRAAKSLANFFNGEVVAMEGAVDAAASEPSEPQPPVATTPMVPVETSSVAPLPGAMANPAIAANSAGGASLELSDEDDDDVPF